MPKTELPGGVESDSAYLAPEFNDWNPAATPMEPNLKSVFQDTLEVQPGPGNQFRYVVNDEYWWNDWNANAYFPNDMGVDNCVINTLNGSE